MEKDIKISVIVPVYNVEKYLRACLDSIVNQTFKDFEVICVNDGSLDNSIEILKDYAQKDSRIVVINQENKGLSGARNTGIAHAKGEYIAFVDSDDYIKTNFLENLYNKAVNTNADVVITNVLYDKNGKLDSSNFKTKRITKTAKKQNLTDKDKQIFCQIPIVWNKLYKTSIIKDNNLKFYEGLKFEDIPFTFVLLNIARNIVVIDNTEYYYRANDASIMAKAYNTPALFDIIKVFDNLKSEINELINKKIIPDKVENLLNDFMISTFYNWARTISPEFKEEFSRQVNKRLSNIKLKFKTDFKTRRRYNSLMKQSR